MRTIGIISGGIVGALGALLITACGGSSTSPSPPPPAPPPPGGGSGATVTITSAGVTPNSVTIAVGQSVTFVNNDSMSHNMASDPHPAHTDCPALNIGPLAAGQSRQSGSLTAARTCGYHDHGDPTNGALKGSVTIR